MNALRLAGYLFLLLVLFTIYFLVIMIAWVIATVIFRRGAAVDWKNLWRNTKAKAASYRNRTKVTSVTVR